MIGTGSFYSQDLSSTHFLLVEHHELVGLFFRLPFFLSSATGKPDPTLPVSEDCARLIANSGHLLP